MDDFKAVGISAKDRKDRLDWYSNKIDRNAKGEPLRVQALYLKATDRYILMSKNALYECIQVEVLGFNKLNGDWEYDPSTDTLSRLAIKQSYRDFSECRDTDTFPISLTINGVDGISQGLYCVVCKDLEYNQPFNVLLWIDGGKSRLVDLRNNCPFQIYKLK